MIVVRGGLGASYLDVGEKQVNISIAERATRGTSPRPYLFSTQFKIVAGYLSWGIEWLGPERVTIDLFEYPNGKPASDDEIVRDMKRATRGKVILRRTFEFVQKTNSREFEQADLEHANVAHSP